MKSRILLKIMCVIIVFTILLITLYTPFGAIRSHLFFGNPIQSLTCNIKKSNYVDKLYGQQCLINGFKAGDGSGSIYFAYIKRNFIGCCYWAGGGSGP